MVLAVPNTLKIGLIAGIVGTVIGVVLALIAGFFGGLPDSIIRLICDSLLTVPGIAILVIIAANIEEMTVEVMALTVAALAWMFPTRTIRAQVLTIRERSYVEVARASGVGSFGLIFREVMPNLMPFIAASFVGAVAGAMLASIGLEALGPGRPPDPDPGHHHLLVAGVHRRAARHVVVVGTTGRRHLDHLPGAVPDVRRDGPLRQPEASSLMSQPVTPPTAGTPHPPGPGPPGRLPDRRRRRPRRRSRQLRPPGRSAPGPHRRVGLRQDHHGHRAHAPVAPARRASPAAR